MGAGSALRLSDDNRPSDNPGPMVSTYQLARVGMFPFRGEGAKDIFSCLFGINSSFSSISS